MGAGKEGKNKGGGRSSLTPAIIHICKREKETNKHIESHVGTPRKKKDFN